VSCGLDSADRLARSEQPVFYIAEFDRWCVTRHADVLKVLRDVVTYSSGDMITLPPIPPALAQDLPDGHPQRFALVSIDPPDHTRIRRLIQRAFTSKRAAEKEPEIRAVANKLIDGFIDSGRMDLLRDYAGHIPVAVVTAILGAPAHDESRFEEWTQDSLTLIGKPAISQEELLELYGRSIHFDRYVRRLIEDRRRMPRDNDLITTLVQATSADAEPTLSDSEIVGLISSVLVAGSETSAILIAHAVFNLLETPDRWKQVVDEPKLIPAAIEETLRHRSPIQGLYRTTTREAQLGGVTLPKGASVYVHIGSTGHDQSVFEEPDSFDIHRPNATDHLGFGRWTHFCLGAPLARVEVRVALECLTARIPGMSLVPGQRLEYRPSLQVPMLRGLLVRWSR
jgi:cytochrome P450